VPEPARIIPIACPFGPAGTVFVYYVDAPEPALIDVGVAGSPEGAIEPALAARGIKLSDVKWILASHGHWDHIGGAGTGKERAPDAKIALHSADAELLADRTSHIRGYQGVRFKFIDDPAAYAAHDAMLLENLSGEMGADRALEDGDRIDLGGGVTLTTVHTPGHSAGAVTFLLDGADLAFTGDSIQGRGAHGTFPLIARENVLEGDAAQTMLRESAELADRLAALAPTLTPPADRPYDPGQFNPVAEMIGANTADPASWPPSIFITMDAFRRAARA
jgi:glyoxylase-like metal-dependent hydrolase (beta-lactamase superfamily II)